jgi:hypothetical protein
MRAANFFPTRFSEELSIVLIPGDLGWDETTGIRTIRARKMKGA